MRHRVTTLTHGQPGYSDLLNRIRSDAALVARMWDDAESRPDELDLFGTRWSIVLVDGQPAAWCAARVEGDSLKCHSNYEVPRWRGQGWYALVYRERHDKVLVPSGLPAVTYLFRQPISLYEVDGWYKTGLAGRGELDGHWWWELRRPA